MAHGQRPVSAVRRGRVCATDAAAHHGPRGFRGVTSRLRAPFVYPLRLENRLEHRYVEDCSRPIPLRFFRNGALLSVDADHGSPWFPLGADALGRDQFARLARATRLSLGVALGAALGAIVIGAFIGGVAGSAGGLIDDGLMRVADVMMALPAVYVVLALRASMPLVLTASQVFWTMVVVLAAVGWPMAARGVRAVVATERTREYRRSGGSCRSSSPVHALPCHAQPRLATPRRVHALPSLASPRLA